MPRGKRERGEGERFFAPRGFAGERLHDERRIKAEHRRQQEKLAGRALVVMARRRGVVGRLRRVVVMIVIVMIAAAVRMGVRVRDAVASVGQAVRVLVNVRRRHEDARRQRGDEDERRTKA